MAYNRAFTPQDSEPSAEQLAAMPGLLLLEFGAPWCAHCQAAQPLLIEAMQAYPALAHLKFEDGKARRLGRGFRVKLWPTLIVLRDGAELARLVRPDSVAAIASMLADTTAV